MKQKGSRRVLGMLLTCVLAVGTAWGAPQQFSFRYDDGKSGQSGGLIRVYEGELDPVEGTVYVYATFEMGPANPIDYVNGLPEWRPEGIEAPATAAGAVESVEADALLGGFVVQEQRPDPEGQPQYLETVTLGEEADGTFIPAVRFGLANDRRAVGKAHVCPWVSDGDIDYYGGYARPNTPYDFKLRLDLVNKRMSAWISGRGDDDWFLLAENVALTTNAQQINRVQAELYPDAPVIESLMVRSKPWAPSERVRPHPLAKEDCVVGRGLGFKFQSLRSTWRKPGKHVTIARAQGVHYGFPDVAEAGPNHLVCVWRNGSHTGGAGGISIAHSYDLGRTWSAPERLHPRGHVPRIQRLKDGTLLALDDVGTRTKLVFFHSSDEGQTWTKLPDYDAAEAGADRWVSCPSRVTELSDGSWLVAGSWLGVEGRTGAIRLHIHRSTDRGQTWEFWSELLAHPPYGTDEPTILELPDGRLVVFTRGSRNDAMPAIKAFSSDNGKTWEIQEVPFPVTGRTNADLLSDGRVMVTYRSGIGPAALRAWIGDPLDPTEFQPTGAHFNDRNTVGLKDGALHIDNDGMRGQFTLYNLRPPDTHEGTVDVTAEVKVVRNDGRAATLSVPFAGKFRLFPDHVEMAHDPSLRVDVTPGQFHTYRVISQVGRVQLYVDGELRLDSDKGDDRLKRAGYDPATQISYYALGFGNETKGFRGTDEEVGQTVPDVYRRRITPEVTGYSIWRRVEEILDDPTTGRREVSWVAARDGFPDQYQLDHIIEVEASVSGHDQGYSGWIELDDGRIFVVNYTDDTSAASTPTPHNFGVPWIRGTFLAPSDLPPKD